MWEKGDTAKNVKSAMWVDDMQYECIWKDGDYATHHIFDNSDSVEPHVQWNVSNVVTCGTSCTVGPV